MFRFFIHFNTKYVIFRRLLWLRNKIQSTILF